MIKPEGIALILLIVILIVNAIVVDSKKTIIQPFVQINQIVILVVLVFLRSDCNAFDSDTANATTPDSKSMYQLMEDVKSFKNLVPNT